MFQNSEKLEEEKDEMNSELDKNVIELALLNVNQRKLILYKNFVNKGYQGRSRKRTKGYGLL